MMGASSICSPNGCLTPRRGKRFSSTIRSAFTSSDIAPAAGGGPPPARQNVPFGFISVMPNLGQASGDAEALIESIRDWTAGFAVPLRAIVIDTLARAIGGGD